MTTGGGCSSRRNTGLCALMAALSLATWPLRALSQITFPGAAPVSAGNLFLHVMPEYFDDTRGVSSMVEKNVLIYGASPDLAFSVQNNSLVMNSAPVLRGGRKQQESATGFGDTVVEGRYTVFRQDGLGSTFRIAPYVGVGLPTGMQDVNSLLPRPLQPGAGAWSSRDAITATYQTLYWNAAAETGYQINSSAAGYRLGNTYYADAAFRYLVWPRALQPSPAAEIQAFVEANYSSAAANRLDGQTLAESGGQQLLIDPGITYTTRLWSLTLMGLLPAYQSFAPGAAHLDFGLLLMYRRSMFTQHHW